MLFIISAQDESPGILENILMAIWAIFQLIVNSSYLAANIIMMVIWQMDSINQDFYNQTI